MPEILKEGNRAIGGEEGRGGERRRLPGELILNTNLFVLVLLCFAFESPHSASKVPSQNFCDSFSSLCAWRRRLACAYNFL